MEIYVEYLYIHYGINRILEIHFSVQVSVDGFGKQFKIKLNVRTRQFEFKIHRAKYNNPRGLFNYFNEGSSLSNANIFFQFVKCTNILINPIARPSSKKQPMDWARWCFQMKICQLYKKIQWPKRNVSRFRHIVLISIFQIQSVWSPWPQGHIIDVLSGLFTVRKHLVFSHLCTEMYLSRTKTNKFKMLANTVFRRNGTASRPHSQQQPRLFQTEQFIFYL